MLDSFVQDVRFAFRSLLRTPLFTIGTAGTIGLGLGILCSGFTVFNAYVFKPVDLPDPHQLYQFTWDSARTRGHEFSLDDVEALSREARHFRVAAAQPSVAVHGARSMTGLLVTGNYFSVLGMRPALGRLLTPADAFDPRAGALVVLAEHAWRSQFGGDPAIVGTRIQLGPTSFEVAGIAARGFNLPGAEGAAFWAPLTVAGTLAGATLDRDDRSWTVVGRLRPEVSPSQASAWFGTWLRQRIPPSSDIAPIAVRMESRATRIPLNRRTLALLSLLMAAFALVLFIACANVTNLLLARSLARQRETSVRLALGASRWCIGRQLVAESLVLAVPAAIVGLLLSLVTARSFPALVVSTFPEGIVPIEALMAPLEPDVRVLALLAAGAVASAVLVSLLPARQALRFNVVRTGSASLATTGDRSRLRTGLVATQVAACVLFLVGAAGLIDRSRQVANPDPGLNYARVASIQIAPSLRETVAARLSTDPAVERVAMTWYPPLGGPARDLVIRDATSGREQPAEFMAVSSEYFALFDIRILRGRGFTPDEAAAAAPVALVSEATARSLWPGLDAIGQTLEVLDPAAGSDRRPRHKTVHVIGIAADVAHGDVLEGKDPSCVYFATGFDEPGAALLLVRGRADLGTLGTAVATAVEEVERGTSFTFLPLRTLVGGLAWIVRAFLALTLLLGGIGLLFACSGTYAVVAFLVERRTREFGVRMALGATVRQLVGGLLTEMLRTTMYGVIAGVLIAVAIGRVGTAVIPIAPALTLRHVLLGSAVMLGAGLVAALLPSLQATRIDPWKALRVE